MPEEDKPMHRVTVTFNGQKHTLEEWTRRETAAADKGKTLDWNDAFASDEDKRTPQPRFSNRGHSNHKIKKYTGYKKRKLPYTGRKKRLQTVAHLFRVMLLPIVAALIVGLAIGLTMLMILNGQGERSDDAWAGDGETAQQQSSAVRASDLRLSAFAIQAGLFTSENKARQIVEALHREGPAAMVAMDGKTAVLVGVSQTDGGADDVLDHVKGQSPSAFKKKWSLEPNTVILRHQSEANEALRMKKLLAALLATSKQGWKGADKKTTAAVDELYRSYAKEARSAHGASLLAHVDTARQALNADSGSAANKNQAIIQQALLDALSDYNALIHPQK